MSFRGYNSVQIRSELRSHGPGHVDSGELETNKRHQEQMWKSLEFISKMYLNILLSRKEYLCIVCLNGIVAGRILLTAWRFACQCECRHPATSSVMEFLQLCFPAGQIPNIHWSVIDRIPIGIEWRTLHISNCLNIL